MDLLETVFACMFFLGMLGALAAGAIMLFVDPSNVKSQTKTCVISMFFSMVVFTLISAGLLLILP